jgi:hypothetical protein
MADVKTLTINDVVYDIRDDSKAPVGYSEGRQVFENVAALETFLTEQIAGMPANSRRYWVVVCNSDYNYIAEGIPFNNHNWFVTIDKLHTDSYAVVHMHTHTNSGYYVKRTIRNGVWDPWEWENPPTELHSEINKGIEYRTTERFMGNPVYTKLINCGTAEDGKQINIAGSTTHPIRYQAVCGGRVAPYYISFPTSGYQFWVDISNDILTLRCGSTLVEQSEPVYVQVWYYK